MTNEYNEPWVVVDRGGNGEVDIDAHDEHFGDVTVLLGVNPKRARRIVACVNTCAGIETDILEQHALGVIGADHSHALHQVTKQRDELLAALKESNRCLVAALTGGAVKASDAAKAIEAAEKAITNVEVLK